MACAAVTLSSHDPGPGLCSCDTGKHSTRRYRMTHLELLGRCIPRVHELTVIPRRSTGTQVERDGFPDDDAFRGRCRFRGGRCQGDTGAFCVGFEFLWVDVGHGGGWWVVGGGVRG